MGRRSFLAIGVGAAIAAPLMATASVRSLVSRTEDWSPTLRPEAYLPAGDFADHFVPILRGRRTNIGASFAPEQFGASPFRSRPGGEQMAMRALTTAVEDLGMVDLRIGLRWDHLAPNGPELSPFYDPYLDYCFGHPNVRNVCLDIGPIKTFRWPETHVPQYVLASLSHRPQAGDEIQLSSELAEVSLAHARRAIAYLGNRYAGRKPVAFSLNEPFNPYGPSRWTLSDEYLVALIPVLRDPAWFPNADIVVNSPGGTDLARIARLFASLIRNDATLRGHLISGFDLYPFVPATTEVPMLNEVLERLQQPARGWYGDAASNLRKAADPSSGFRIEVTEAQAEPFGSLRMPGNSLSYYQHVLAESIDRVLDPRGHDAPIRMFGIEYQLQRLFSGRASAENRGILDLTRTLNRL